MSIAQQNKIDELERRIKALEQRVNELEADATWMKNGERSKTLTLPEKRKPNG